MKVLYIDLFCGAGGTSSGVNSARLDGRQCAQVVACVNHDKNAIASHAANHPEALHFTEDIRTLELSPLVRGFMCQNQRLLKESCLIWTIVAVLMAYSLTIQNTMSITMFLLLHNYEKETQRTAFRPNRRCHC